MKVQDLRIGNKIKFKTGDIMTVTAVSLVGVYVEEKEPRSDGWFLSFSQFSPIPLTEEIAIKFGYECLSEMAIDFSKNKYNIKISSSDLLKLYVHQSQNLFFALTGKELILK